MSTNTNNNVNIKDIIIKKINKEELSEEEIKYFIENYTNGNIKDYFAASLITAIMINSLTDDEIYYFTKYMAESGQILSLSDEHIDKHSTGGVGDKLTIVLMPILAVLGYKIGKSSGRSLGITGGTADKLESIPGLKLDLDFDTFQENIEKRGICLVSQSVSLAPADKKIYALRDVIGCANSIPLITSSILSKKVAGGSKTILLNITYGNGAFMENKKKAKLLEKALVTTAEKFGIKLIPLVTSMENPLGYSVGNAVEVVESLEFLSGKENPALKKEVVDFITLLYLNKKGAMDTKSIDVVKDTKRKVEKLIDDILESKEAYFKLTDMIQGQGGKLDKFLEMYNTQSVQNAHVFPSLKTGKIKKIDAYTVAKCAFETGAGRDSKEDEIDYFSGIRFTKQVGQKVKKNEELFAIYVGQRKLDELKAKNIDVKEFVQKIAKRLYDNIVIEEEK